jgi:uncharacterized protein YkwD
MAPNQNNAQNNTQNDNTPRISATSQKSPNDYYVIINGNGTTARQGTYDGAPSVSNLTGGSRVRVLDMQNGWYVTQLPNNNVASIPMNTAKPDGTKPTQPVPTVQGAPAGQTNEESSMLNLINSERSKAGLKPLSANGDLDKVARLK